MKRLYDRVKVIFFSETYIFLHKNFMQLLTTRWALPPRYLGQHVSKETFADVLSDRCFFHFSLGVFSRTSKELVCENK